MNLPLDGLTVIALEQAVAAPYCTSRLAEAGARVIKVERAEGDFARAYDHVVNGDSAYFVWLNRGKESISLDIKSSDDARLLDSMIASADVLVQNLSPGATQRAGFGSDELRLRHPRLITCDITGYGTEGQWAKMKAYDFLIQCETGLAAITGGENEPSRVGISIADISCGATAHSAVLQALYEREKTGLGSGISISLFDCLSDWMTVPLLHFDYGGKAPGRVGLRHPSIAPYGVFTCSDDKTVVVAIQNEREWRNFCETALQKPQLADHALFATNVLRVTNRGALEEAISETFMKLTGDQVVERLMHANVAYASFNGVQEFSNHPQLRRAEVSAPHGVVRMPEQATRWAGTARHRFGPVPGLNQHGDRLREEFTAEPG